MKEGRMANGLAATLLWPADGPLLPGEDGELGDMVAEEMHSYFQSPEGSGAFKSALGTYMLVS